MSKKYEPICVNSDLSVSALREAAKIVGQASTYYLHVAPSALDYAFAEVIPQVGAFSMGTVFRPEIVLQGDNDLSPDEWFIAANGLKAGSPGA